MAEAGADCAELVRERNQSGGESGDSLLPSDEVARG